MAEKQKQKRTQLGTLITEELKEKLGQFSDITGIPKAKIVEMSLEDFFEKHKAQFESEAYRND